MNTARLVSTIDDDDAPTTPAHASNKYRYAGQSIRISFPSWSSYPIIVATDGRSFDIHITRRSTKPRHSPNFVTACISRWHGSLCGFSISIPISTRRRSEANANANRSLDGFVSAHDTDGGWGRRKSAEEETPSGILGKEICTVLS